MDNISSLLGIAAALSIGAASPGPSFVMIARTAASSGRTQGLFASLGMGSGALLFAIASLLGLNTLLSAVPTIYLALKLCGGLYLAYLGWRIWRGASQSLALDLPESPSPSPSSARHFLSGLITQLSNPKTAIVYASVFAAFLPSSSDIRFNMAIALIVFVIEAGWYALVATILSAKAPRASYLRFKKWVDRAAGGIMMVLGIKLAISAR